MGMKQKKIYFFLKKKFKMADSKKAHFSKSPILKIFSRKFLRFVLGLVGLYDAKGIDVAQRIWPWGCPTKLKNSQKVPKMHFLAVSELLSDSLTAIYIELHQCPLHHSILLTQGQIWEIFAKKFWELAILKSELFLSRPFWIFFSKKKIFFCFIPMKISPNLYGRMDGSKFWCFPWFPENSLLCVILRYTVYVKVCCKMILCFVHKPLYISSSYFIINSNG